VCVCVCVCVCVYVCVCVCVQGYKAFFFLLYKHFITKTFKAPSFFLKFFSLQTLHKNVH
jgi:hypothetical protein